MKAKSYRFELAPLAYLDKNQMEGIHAAALEILADPGCRIHHNKTLKLLEKNGAWSNSSGTVSIPPALVEKVLGQAPEKVTVYNRYGEPALHLEGTNVYFGTGSDCQYLLDPDTGKPRQFLYSDVVDACRLADALPDIDFIMGMGLAPDLNPLVAVQEKTAVMFKHTTKPLVLISESRSEVLQDMIDMAATVAGGERQLERKPNFLLLVDPTSPLVHTANALDKLLCMAHHRLPVIYAPGIMAGATSPVTVAGAVAQACAEILTGLMVHQLSSPGAPFIFGGGMSPMDMKSGQPTYAAPEAMVAQAALCQMGRTFYKLPTFGFGGCSASKCCDTQAVNEAATYLMMSAWMGTNLVHDIGYIEFGMTYSLELLVLCNEIIGQIRRMMAGLTVDPEHLALNAIRRTGPGGSFLMDPHTLAHFRSNWMPDLTDRATRQTWDKKGASTMEARAVSKIHHILENHMPEPLPAEILLKIEKIIQRAKPGPG